MKKLLGILVLGLMLNGCGGAHIENNPVRMLQTYKNAPVNVYKAFFEMFEQGKYTHRNFWRGSYKSSEEALRWGHEMEYCSNGCKVIYIGNEKISYKRQRLIAEQYLPSYIFEKYFSKPEKVVKKKKKQKKKKESSTEDKKEEKKSTLKEEDEKDDWF